LSFNLWRRRCWSGTKGTKGRDAGTQELLAKARQIKAQDTRWGERRVKFQAVFANGRVMEIGAHGGYSASNFLDAVKSHKGDAISWLMDQGSGRYAGLDMKATPLTGVTMTVYAKDRDPEPGFGY
jgi:hypothetical protein